MPNQRIVLFFKVYMAKSRRRNLGRTRRTKRRRVGGFGDRSLFNLLKGKNEVMHPEQKRKQCKEKFKSIDGIEFAKKEYEEWYDEYKRDHRDSKDVDLICGKDGEQYHKNTRYRPKSLDGIGSNLYKFFKQKQEEQDAAWWAEEQELVDEKNSRMNYA